MGTWLRERIERGKTKVFSEKVHVTPELAEIILNKHNKDNRPIYPAKLQQLKSDMNSGRFVMNGESIIIANTGDLNDGQHRLKAIAETNKAQDMLFVFGVERDSRQTVDTGKARSAGDHLGMAGWPYAIQISSITKQILAFESTQGKSIGQTGRFSVSETMERAKKDALIPEIAAYVGTHASKLRHFLRPAFAGLVFYTLSQVSPIKAKTFMDKLRDGTNLDANDPIHVARQYMLARPKLLASERVEIVLRTWNFWIKDQRVQRIALQGKFPELES